MAVECSVVVPLHNEESNLSALHLRLSATLRRLAIPYEFIYVDDGSTDRTAEMIRELHAQDPSVKGIFLSRAFGRQAALCAGLEAATGRVVISMDGDLRDPPELIPELLEKWSDGFQVVYARRRMRHEGFLRQAANFTCRRILRRIARMSTPLDAGDYTLMDRAALDQLNALPERTRLIRGLRGWVGFRQTDLFYDRAPRKGESRESLVRVGVQALFIFSDAPLRTITLAGFLICGVALALLGSRVAGLTTFSLTGSALIGLAGMQMLGLGVLAEYVARIHQEVRGRPLYIASERLGFRTLPRPARSVLEFLPGKDTEREEPPMSGRPEGSWTDSMLVGEAQQGAAT